MDIVIWILIFGFGAVVGSLGKALYIRRHGYSGTIHVSHDDEKLVYSLELEDDPETLQFKKEIVFKVEILD